MAEVVVIGGGLGALRAAAALAAAGRRVVYLQEGAHLAGAAHADLPTGTGAERFSRVPAGWRPVEGATAGLYIGGALHALPLSRTVLARLFPVGQVAGAAGAWARTRGAQELARLIGGGHEVRTYADWVQQHYGMPIFERLFQPYAERRFGDPAGVTANVARAAHGGLAEGFLACPAGGRAAELAALAAGVEVHVGVMVEAIEPGPEGAVVRTSAGEFSGQLFIDLPPPRVVALLGAHAPAGLAAEVAWLRTRHALEVNLVGGASLPWITHVVDGPGQAYRFVRQGLFPGSGALQGTISVQLTVEDNDPLWAAGDAVLVEGAVAAVREVSPDVVAEGARVQRLANHAPVWVTTTAARMRRYVMALAELKLVPVGRAGTYARLSGGPEADYLGAVVGGMGTREAFRRFVEPPVVVEEPRAHLTDFVNE